MIFVNEPAIGMDAVNVVVRVRDLDVVCVVGIDTPRADVAAIESTVSANWVGPGQSATLNVAGVDPLHLRCARCACQCCLLDAYFI